MRRLGLGVRQLVCGLERAIAALAGRHGIDAAGRRDAPGVYVSGRKLASLGLRVRHGASYHGLALNVDMDLEPFRRINPCGHAGLEMTQLSALGARLTVREAADQLAPLLCRELGLEWDGRWDVGGDE
jgi:lipoyl(octanoyl) transferase